MDEYFLKIKNFKFERPLFDRSSVYEFFSITGISKAQVFTGRSNVGKSSLINSLYQTSSAQTSNTPGRTKQINVYSFIYQEEKIFLFDLPGYGHAKVSKSLRKDWDNLMEAFFEIAPKHFMWVNVQDARHPFTINDEEFNKFLKKSKLNIIILINKLDKIKSQKEKATLDKLVKTQSKKFFFHSLFRLSTKNKDSLSNFLQFLKNYLDSGSF